MTLPDLQELILDHLQLWDCVGQAMIAEGEIQVTTEAGYHVAVRPTEGDSARWSVRIAAWAEGEMQPPRTSLKCSSVITLLRTMRSLVGAKGAEARIGFSASSP